jgi:hypothetical protein
METAGVGGTIGLLPTLHFNGDSFVSERLDCWDSVFAMGSDVTRQKLSQIFPFHFNVKQITLLQQQDA